MFSCTAEEKDRVLQVTKDLVSLESDAMLGHEKAMGEYVFRFLETLGIEAHRQPCAPDRFNVIARIPGHDRGRTLAYSAHLDVVPQGDAARWSSPPYQPQVRDGKLYGRGACDMKGSIACSLCAVEWLTRHGVRPANDVLLMYDVDEENANLGLKTYLEHPQSADFLLVGEPTGLRMAVGHRGVMAFTVTFHGKSVHAGQAEQGRNAIYAAADAMTEIRRLNETLSAQTQAYLGKPSIHVTQIQGGTKVNVIPDTATLRIDRRLIGGENVQSCTQQVRNALQPVCQRTGCDCDVQVTTYCPPGSSDATQPALQRIAALLTRLGLDPTPKAFEASCEAGLLQERLKVPMVILGPGSIAQAHQIDEYIALEQLWDGLTLYIHLFANGVE